MIGSWVVEIAPSDGPLVAEADRTWVDVSSYVREVSSWRGRSNELDTVEAGRCSVTFGNADRRFDPLFASGPFFGDLTPGVPLRVSVDAGSGAVPIFTGFVLGWPQEYASSDTDATVTVTAVDALKILNRSPLTVSALEEAFNLAQSLWPLDDPALVARDAANLVPGFYRFTPKSDTISFGASSFPCTVFDGEQRVTVPYEGQGPLVPTAWLFDIDWTSVADGQVMTLVERTSDGDQTYVYAVYVTIVSTASRSFTVYTIPFSNIGTRYTTSEISNPSGGFVLYMLDTDTLNLNGVGYDMSSSADATSLNLVARSDALHIGYSAAYSGRQFYGKIAMVGHISSDPWTAVSAEQLSGAAIDDVLDRLGWPAADRDLATGVALIPPATLTDKTPLSVLKLIEATEQGLLFVNAAGEVVFRDRYHIANATAAVTFSDDGADNGYLAEGFAYDFDDTLVVNDCAVSSIAASTSTAISQTSIDTYGPLSESLDTLCRSANETQALAEYRVLRFETPQVRARAFSLRPESGAGTYDDLLSLDLGDKFVLERTPQGVGSQIVQTLVLDGVGWDLFPGDCVVTLQGSPPDPNTYAVFDTGEFDNDIFGL